MSDSWRQVLDAPAGQIRPGDAAGLGPPPRDLAEAHRKYIKLMKPSLAAMWIMLAVLFLGGGALVFAMAPSVSTVPWLGIGFVVLAVYSHRKASANRGRLIAVLRDGTLRMAECEDVRQVPVGRRTIMGQKYRHYARFAIDGRKVLLVAMNDGMSLLPVGTQVEVVYHSDYPDEIIPTYLLM